MVFQNGQLTRRAMLGSAGATLLGLQVRNLSAFSETSHAPKAQHVILFWNGGGMSHLDTWDPKPGRPSQGEFRPIATSAEGVFISEIFPRLARQMHHCALIRSLVGTSGEHLPATYNLQTGTTPASNLHHPGIGSLVVRETETVGDLPAYVSISGRAPRAGYLGPSCEACFIPSPGDRDPYLAFPESVDEAARLLGSPALEAFRFEHVPATTWNRYGDTTFGRGALLAKRLVERGVRFIQVNRCGFDTHTGNFPAMRAHAKVMDPALSSLVEDLADSGLLEKTLVVMLSEFGRSPRINAGAGRDHWPNVFSCFLAGGGVQGGTVVGASDKDGCQPAQRPVTVSDLHATIFHTLLPVHGSSGSGKM